MADTVKTSRPDFVHLHNHTHFSVLDGFATPAEYLRAAHENGQRGLGITDHGSMGGLAKILTMDTKGIQVIPGVEFYVAPDTPEGAKANHPIFYGTPDQKSQDVSARGAYLHLTAWAVDEKGLANLYALMEYSSRPEHTYKATRIDFSALLEHSDGLVVSTGCPSSEVCTRLRLGQYQEAINYTAKLRDIFGPDRLFIEVMNHGMKSDLERNLLKDLRGLQKKFPDLGFLATNDSHYAFQTDAPHHEEMLAANSNSFMSEPSIANGGKRFAFDGDSYFMRTTEEMYKMFPPEDWPDALANTVKIAEMASGLSLSYNPQLKPEPPLPVGKTEDQMFKQLIREGLKTHYQSATPEEMKEIKERVKKEYEVIHSSNFEGYFLTVQEYLNWAKEKYSVRDKDGEILAPSIGPGRGCLAGSTIVWTPGGYKAIKDIQKGDQVMTHRGNIRPVLDRFMYLCEEPMVTIQASYGMSVTMTRDHRVFVSKNGQPPQWTEAQDVQPGDFVYTPAGFRVQGDKPAKDGGQLHQVMSVRITKPCHKVYDITVAEDNSFMTGSFVVHNSVGGSIIAYLLGISNVDPLRYGLLFERFLTPGRGPVYEVTLDDGTVKTLNASEKTESGKYVWQLQKGDEVSF